MGRDVRTNVVLTAETKGLDKALREVLGINQTALEGLKEQSHAYGKVQKDVKGMQTVLQDLTKRQLELRRAMAAVDDKSSSTYREMEEDLKKVNRAATEQAKTINLVARAYQAEAEAAKKLSAAQREVMNQQRQQEKQQQEQRRGAFTQGFLQAAAPGMAPLFLQRGPGMGRQFAGQMLGTGLRRAGQFGWGMTGGGAFSGLQGMQQGLAGIPIVGGFLAGQLGTAAGYSQQALEYQRQRVEALPYLGGPGNIQRVQQVVAKEGGRRAVGRQFGQMQTEFDLKMLNQQLASGEINQAEYERKKWMVTQGPESYYNKMTGEILPGKQAQAKYWEETAPEMLGERIGGTYKKPKFDIAGYWSDTIFGSQHQRQTRKAQKALAYTEALRARSGDKAWQAAGPVGSKEARRMATGGYSDEQEEMIRIQQDIENRGRRTREQIAAREKEERGKAARKIWQAREAPFQTPATLGRKYRGLGRQESVQEAAQLMQATGGVFGRGTPAERAQQQEFMGTAFAARTAFGVDLQTAGAFGAGARRGGLVGGPGGGAKGLTAALSDAMKLGLEGSEINTYLQSMAQGIQQFQHTGIPFERKSLTSMATELSKGGLSGTRAGVVGRQFQSYIQNVSATGPRSGADLLAMNIFSGFTGGGQGPNLEESQIAMEQMKEGGLAGGKMNEYVKRLMTMRGGGWQGRTFARGFLKQQLGVNIGAKEMQLWGRQLMGEKLSPEEQKTLEAERTKREKGTMQAMVAQDPAALMKLASATVTAMGPNLRSQASLLDTQLKVGQKMLPVIQNLEQSAANTVSAFSNLASKTLTDLTKGMTKFTGQLDKLTAEGGGLLKLTEILGIH